MIVKSILLFIGLSTHSLLFCQEENQNYERLQEWGDSLYKSGNYLESARAFEESLRATDRVSPRDRWISARSWARAGYPDSAFKHLRIYANTPLLSLPIVYNVLTEPAFSKLREDKQWQLIEDSVVRKYTLIANRYAERGRSGFWTNPTHDAYDAARAWAAANEKDSAFLYLHRIVNSSHNSFIDYPKLSRDTYFSTLHQDARWQVLLDSLKQSWKWIPTRHVSQPTPLSMIASIDPGSIHLKSDGKGSYMDGVDKIVSKNEHGYNLEISGHRLLYRSGNRKELSPRSIIVHLNEPLNGSGATDRGILNDNDFELHILYKIDTTVTPQVVYNFRDIAVGTSVEADRTELIFYIEGKAHLLTFGPWGFGQNNEPNAHGGKIHGAGTSPVIVRRESPSRYLIYTKAESTGRLWEMTNLSKPINKGLYRFRFSIQLEEKSNAGK